MVIILTIILTIISGILAAKLDEKTQTSQGILLAMVALSAGYFLGLALC